MDEQKICCTCKSARPVSDFCKNRKTKDGLERRCRACRSEAAKKYYNANRETMLKKHAKRYSEKRDEKLAYSKAHYQANKERILEQHRQWKSANKDRNKKINDEWVANNREKCNAASRRWRRNNPESAKAVRLNANSKRYERYKGGPGYKAMKEWVDSQEKICFYCKEDCSEGYEIDHFYPLARGGKHVFENLRVSCTHCNRRKSARDPYEFMVWLAKN